MTREQLEHLIRAAAELVCDNDIVVIGSQAILGQFPDAPPGMRMSTEADLLPFHHPDRADLIDGSIGELSPFHSAYGYYAQGVSETTAKLPAGWRERLVVVAGSHTRGARGLCLEIHDLLVAKAIAGREKDLSFLSEAANHRLASRTTLLERLATVEVDEAVRQATRARIEKYFP